MINCILFVGTIIMILIMEAVTVLITVFSVRKKDNTLKKMRNLSGAFLLYLISGYLQFYFTEYVHLGQADKITGILSDCCYFLFMVCWVLLIIEVSENKKIITAKVIIAVTAVYGILAEGIILFAGKYNSAGEMTITPVFLHEILMGLNAVYVLWMIGLNIRYFIFAYRKMEPGEAQRRTKSAVGVMLIYLIWTLITDFQVLRIPGTKISEVILIDPLMIAYAALGAWFIFKKRPLRRFAEQDERKKEELLQTFAEAHHLTRRETEVLEQVCNGLNNPGIAAKLCIAENTVKRHLNNIFQKTGIGNRYELIAQVLEQ